jgi:isoquinoline 1-oxidoreductase beta subunit
VPGVRHVVRVAAGVAVVAEGFWAASKGRDALKIEWDEGEGAGLDSAAIEARLLELVGEEGRKARLEGQGAAALSGAAKLVEADYHAPYLAHACMEPMNCTADVREDGVTLWVPTQAQAAPALFGGGSRGVAAKIAGVPESNVVVHTTQLGGGFGRRSETDYVAEAVEVSKEVGAPVQLVWTREDDIRHDFYRPAAQHRLKAGLDEAGKLVAWSHHVAAQSIMGRFVPGWVPDFLAHLGGPIKGGVDPSAVEGAVDLPYAVANHEVRYHEAEFPVPIGFWRSVGHSHTAFAVECFVDELAAAAGKDPVQFRLDHLPSGSRERRVLEAVAEKAGWGTPLPAGTARGVAVHGSFGSYAAEVAEVRLEGRQVRVERVVCAFDCGIVVNPDILVAQVESGIAYGLSAALMEKVTLKGGRVEQGNFEDYPVLTMAQMPRIEVVLVPSGDAPGGAGEPATPPIAPAVANAVSSLTGKRVRRLPIEV